MPVQFPVVFPRVPPVRLGRYDRFRSLVPDEGQYPVAFIPLVGDDGPSLDTGQQRYGLGNIRPLTAGERETYRTPLGVNKEMNLGAQSAAGAAQSLTLAPPLPQAAC